MFEDREPPKAEHPEKEAPKVEQPEKQKETDDSQDYKFRDWASI